MATFNSAQNGNWNTDATWTEAGHPTANDDITIITHEVTYDVGVSAVTWGNCTINSSGILIFPITASSKMLFNATGILTVNSSGELRAGTSGAPIGSGFLCQLHWPQGSAGRNVLVLNNGGKIDIYGDPAYYGSTKTAILDSQWAAGSGLTLYVEGDYSSKWAAGQHFVIHDFAKYASYTTDAEIFEIDSIGAYDAGNDRTPIVVTAAGDSDTFLIGAKLWMLDRNIELLDPGSSWAVNGYGSYTERLRFDNNQGVVVGAASAVSINESLFRGWDRAVDGGNGFSSNGSVFLNNARALSTVADVRIIDSLFVSNYNLFYVSSAMYETCILDAVACYNVVYSGVGVNIEGDLIGCYKALDSAKYVYLTGNIYSCYRGASAVENLLLIGDITGCNDGLYSAINTLIVGGVKNCSVGINTSKEVSIIGSIINSSSFGIYSPTGLIKLKNGEFSGNASNIAVIDHSSVDRSVIAEDYTIGGTKRELEIYANSGEILNFHNGDAHWQVPPSGESFILEMLPNSYCGVLSNVWLSLSPDHLNMMFTYVTSGVKTFTFKIYPVGWTSALDNDDIVLEAFYLAGAGVGRTRVVNTTATYANGGWRDLSVSFTAGQDGIVYFVIHLKKYEAGDYVLIDPEWGVS